MPFGFCGSAALLRTDVLRAAGGTPGSLFCYYEETDTSWRQPCRWHVGAARYGSLPPLE